MLKWSFAENLVTAQIALENCKIVDFILIDIKLEPW